MPSAPTLAPDASGDATEVRRRLREELARLRLKLEHSTDKDIKAVLQMRIDQILTELPTDKPQAKAPLVPFMPETAPPRPDAEPEPEEESSDAAAPLTPQQLQEVDRLIRQARVEKMRNNAVEATRLLQDAARLAPSSAPVLEALGDNLIERRQLMPAIKAYKKALRLNPKNVGLEEKLATAVLRADSAGSVEDQLRRGAGDSPFLTQADIVARTPYAIILSVICPGVGHLALGKTGAGFSLLGTWIACWIWLLIKHEEVAKLARSIAGKPERADTIVFIPMFLMVIIWLGAMASLKPRSAASSRRTIDHPIPPANLPFE